MFCVIETNSSMDHRKKIICGNCGKEHVMFSCTIKKCIKCNQKLENIYLMSNNESYKADYYFHGVKK
ncbi:MAG: hypothetical protein U9Q27_02295 [Patescibacteria group bacterium]|nr:hypothetical protein [Patescibacteria group bacterium]